MQTRAMRVVCGLVPWFGACGPEPLAGDLEPRVLNGTDTTDYDKSVFNLARGEPICTTSNVKYPRCMLTAAHCIKGEKAADLTVYQGKTTFAWDTKAYKANAAAKRQTVAAMAGRDYGANQRWLDIAVLWVELKDGNDPPRIAEADYTQLEWVNSTPLKNIEYGPISNYTSMGGPKQMTIVGYGPKDDNETSGVKRKGQVRVQAYHLGPSQNAPKAGSFYNIKVDPGVNPGQFPCQGDSGGPVLYEGKIAGVASQVVTNGSCEAPVVARYTGLEKDAVTGTDSNHDWLVKTIEKTCAKKADTKTEPGGTDQKRGKVEGNISPGQSYLEGDLLDDDVACGDDPSWSDCTELVHHGQTLTLTAVETDPDWVFEQWENGADCPCDGSSNPVCALSYAAIGRYDASTSDDDSLCVARFVPRGDTSTGGDSSGTTATDESGGSTTSGAGTTSADDSSATPASTGDGSTTSGAGTTSADDSSATPTSTGDDAGSTTSGGDDGAGSTLWTSGDTGGTTLWSSGEGGESTWWTGATTWTPDLGGATTWLPDLGGATTTTAGEGGSWSTGWEASTSLHGDLGGEPDCQQCHMQDDGFGFADADAESPVLRHGVEVPAIDLLYRPASAR
jgi:hypothetical protein